MLLLCISAIGLFLSIWILLPAPTLSFMTLAVGMPEISPILLGLNTLIALLSLWLAINGFKHKRYKKSRRFLISLAFSIIGLFLSFLPLSQLPIAGQLAESAITQALGPAYLAKIPEPVQAQMRAQSFRWVDVLRGLPSLPTRFTGDIQFASPSGVPLTLDIYRPPQIGNYPAIMIIHGGGWQGGRKSAHAEFSRYMAARGYVVWAISYRFAPRYRFPAQLEDVQAALDFMRQHAQAYETDLSRIAVMGRSAGAHLAMLAAYRSNSPSIRAVVNYYGPVDLFAGYYDLPSPDPINSRVVLRAFLGGTPEEFGDRYRAASPINYVNPALPRSLLIYGGKDHIVMAKFGREMAKRLQSAGNKAVFIEIPWADHAFDAVFQGLSNQFALYYTERFLAWALL